MAINHCAPLAFLKGHGRNEKQFVRKSHAPRRLGDIGDCPEIMID
jgi:hypothetical protein